MKIRPESYVRMFHGKGYSFAVSEVFISWYRRLDVLVTSKNGDHSSYMPEKTVSRCTRNGLVLFQDSFAFRKYVRDFRDYNNRVRKIPLLLKKKIFTEDDYDAITSLLGEFFKHYCKTEFFYTDAAYTKKVQGIASKTLVRNLDILTHLKIRNRVLLNTLLLEDASYFARLLKKLGQEFGYPKIIIQEAAQSEIKNLFGGRRLNIKILKERKKFYCMVPRAGVLVSLNRTEQRKIVSDFGKYFFRESNILHGVSANPGFVRGVVKVIYPDQENFSRYLRDVASMKKGLILVAETTSPEITLACKKAIAIVTNGGGMGSHAAIISRELGIPCVVGTQTATHVLKSGDRVEVDASEGLVKILKRASKVVLKG